MIQNAVLYVRVSAEDQDLAGQEDEIRSYAATRGWEVLGVYREKTSATGRVERGQFEQLLQDALKPNRGWGRILVWALDRWSREPSFVKAIGTIEELDRAGARWHSFKEPQLDSGEDAAPNLGRDLLRGILPTIAAFEARRRSDRTLVAMQEIRSGRRKTRSGKPPGRPRKMTPELNQRIRELRMQPGPDGKRRTWGQIARIVDIPAGTCSKVTGAHTERISTSVNGPAQIGEKGVKPPILLPPA